MIIFSENVRVQLYYSSVYAIVQIRACNAYSGLFLVIPFSSYSLSLSLSFPLTHSLSLSLFFPLTHSLSLSPSHSLSLSPWTGLLTTLTPTWTHCCSRTCPPISRRWTKRKQVLKWKSKRRETPTITFLWEVVYSCSKDFVCIQTLAAIHKFTFVTTTRAASSTAEITVFQREQSTIGGVFSILTIKSYFTVSGDQAVWKRSIKITCWYVCTRNLHCLGCVSARLCNTLYKPAHFQTLPLLLI